MRAHRKRKWFRKKGRPECMVSSDSRLMCCVHIFDIFDIFWYFGFDIFDIFDIRDSDSDSVCIGVVCACVRPRLCYASDGRSCSYDMIEMMGSMIRKS